MKILHMADIHARDADIDEIKKCLEFIVELAHREKPDLIVNAGDTFDSRNVRLDSMSAKLVFRIFSELADIAPVAVIIGTPLHDGEAAEALQFINARCSIWVSSKPEQIYLYGYQLSATAVTEGISLCDAAISMVPQPTKQYFETNSDIKGSDSEIAQAMNGLFAGFGAQASQFDCPHILVGHWNTTGSLISETQTLTGVDIEISKDQMALANADIVCLGHIHKQQKLGTNIFYPGSIYRLNYGELDEKGVYIHTVNSNSVDSAFERTPTRRLVKFDRDLTVEGAIDELDAVLYNFDPDEIKDSLARCEFKIYQDEANKIDKDKIKAFYISAGAQEVDVRIIRIPRENVRSERILKLQTLREKLIERARLNDEVIPETILAKADLLESETGEQIVARIATA